MPDAAASCCWLLKKKKKAFWTHPDSMMLLQLFCFLDFQLGKDNWKTSVPTFQKSVKDKLFIRLVTALLFFFENIISKLINYLSN